MCALYIHVIHYIYTIYTIYIYTCAHIIHDNVTMLQNMHRAS